MSLNHIRRAVIFDLNGVFITSPPLSERFAKDHSVPLETFLPVLKETMRIVRLPGAPDAYSLWEPHLRSWNIRLTHQQFYDYWFSAEKPSDEMIAYTRELKTEGWHVLALSNNFRERTDFYAKTFPFMREVFDDVAYSWQTGLVKPDERCFSSLCAKHGLDPVNCFYFDDSQENVDAARRVGLLAHRFTGLVQTRHTLNAR